MDVPWCIPKIYFFRYRKNTQIITENNYKDIDKNIYKIIIDKKVIKPHK